MKLIITSLLFLLLSMVTFAQIRLTPGKNSFEKRWIKTGSYQMIWYVQKDTSKIVIGEISTKVLTSRKFLTIVTSVAMKSSQGTWIDSTVAWLQSLAPLRHSSNNAQREMVLNFGPIVTGYYNDKVKQEKIQIIDTTRTSYFDSNLYPALIAWLPLKEGYTQDLSIYDYNPSGTIGVIGAFIQMVSSGRYQSIRSGLRDVWVTTVRDEIGGDKHQSSMTYYIDKADRRLWKQEINIGTRKMLMLRKEEQ
jgi:hypothetical protein